VISTSPSPVPTLKNRLQPTGAHHKLSAVCQSKNLFQTIQESGHTLWTFFCLDQKLCASKEWIRP
jgi:hypothetical protein